MINKKTTLALAVAAALPFSASAIDVTTGADSHAYNLFGATTSTAVPEVDLEVDVVASDVFQGRTTGFNVQLILTGAEWVTAPTAGAVTVGAALPSCLTMGGTMTADWAVGLSSQSGGTITYTFTPPTTCDPGEDIGVTGGNLFTILAPALAVDVTNLGTIGNAVDLEVKVNDPVGGTTLATATDQLLSSLDGVTATETLGEFDTTNDQRIDVGSDTGLGVASKTTFTANGDLGNFDTVFDGGLIDIMADGIAAGTDALDNVDGGDDFVFDGADTFTVTVTSTGLEPFIQAGGSIILEDNSAACGGGVALDSLIGGAAGTAGVAPTATTAIFEFFATDDGFGDDGRVCFNVPAGNTVPIVQQSPTWSAAVDFASAAGTVIDETPINTGSLNEMIFNGTVTTAWTVNPASNVTQQSILRFTNPSAVAGLVTLVAWDDAGMVSGTVTFTLGAGESIQLTAADLENGNATKGLTGSFGDGTGKWYVEATGEFANMRVTSLIRTPDGFLTDLSATTMGE